ncbi:MAG: hypothetical protein AAGA88_03085 [Pseudomonadota bacterium]
MTASDQPEEANTAQSRRGSDAVKRLIPDVAQRFEAALPFIAKWLPLYALGYFAIMAIIRITMSPNLEVDEAQFVGHTGFSLGYDGWHPPLYGWLVTVALWITFGAWVPALALVKALLLAAHAILAWDLVRRMTDDPMAGLIAAVSLAFLPQFIWMGQITLAHSVLVGAATLGIIHALYLWLLQPGIRTSAWLALAISAAVLAKYNVIVLLFGLAAAIAITPAIRVRLERRWVAVTAGLVAIATIPHFLWGLRHLDQTADGTSKFYRGGSSTFYDIPVLGLDGFTWFVLAILAWIAALVVVLWFASGRPGPKAVIEKVRPRYAWDFPDRYRSFVILAVGLSLAIMGLIVLLIDMHRFHERYLTPILLPLVPMLGLILVPKPKNRAPLVLLAVLVAIAAPIGKVSTVLLGDVRFAYPYQAFSAQMAAELDGPTLLVARRQVDGANLAIRLENVSLPVTAAAYDGAKTLLLVADQREERFDRLLESLPVAVEPKGERIMATKPLTNFSGADVTYYFQTFSVIEKDE